jgi:uncharacterized GH25 family protein
MNTRAIAWLGAILLAAFNAAAADGWRTLNLTRFTNYTVFEKDEASWLLSKGEQVIDDVPFHISGAVQIYHARRLPANAAELRLATNAVRGIPVEASFDRLHLLTAVEGSAPESNVVTRVVLDYVDGTNATLELAFGDQVRRWDAALHKTERTVRDTNRAAVAWIGQSSKLAGSDRYARLFRVTLDNPRPAVAVRTLAIEAAHTNCSPVVAGITVSQGNAARLDTTVPLPDTPFPDMRRRNGAQTALSGAVRTAEGRPLSNAIVRLTGQREFNTSDWQASTDNLPAETATQTDPDGRFSFPAVRDDRLYSLLAMAPGYGAEFYRGADPKSVPVEVRLSRPSVPEGQQVWAQVVDGEGRPLPWVTVEVGGVRNDAGSSYGGSQGFPSRGATDMQGEFRLARKQPFSAVQVKLAEPGFASRNIWLDVGDARQTVTLDVGGQVRGRVMLDGRPLTNVQVGVAGVERSSEVFAGHYKATTDANGEFVFQHLPSSTSWWLYGVMDSLKQHGAIRPRQVTSGTVGSTNDVGDLEVGAGLQLVGEVRTRSDEPLPGDLRVTVGPENHWDSQTVTVGKDGKFAFTGLVPGLLSVNVQREQWRLTHANRSLDNSNPWRLTGILNDSKPDLVIEIERGERVYNSMSSGGNLPMADYASARPLFGAESSGPAPITVAGQVVNAATGKPVSHFSLTPGRKPPVTTAARPAKPLLQQMAGAFRKEATPWNELPWWDGARRMTFTNGQFNVDFIPLTSVPMLRVEADGYEPFISEPFPDGTNGLVVRMLRGAGPSGLVLRPDGKPATGAVVWYAVAREQAGLTGRQLSGYGSREGMDTTDSSGSFSFPARTEGHTLFVAHESGWARYELGANAKSLKLQLAAWSTVTGRLVSSNGAPMPGVKLHLTHPYNWTTGDPIINVQGYVTTDAKGGFLFTNAAPGRLELNRQVPLGMGGGGWSYVLQTWFICQPGVTNDLGNVTYDSPPPPPLMEKVKRKLGL